MFNLESKIEDIRDKMSEISDTLCKIDKEVAQHKVAFAEHQKQDEGMYEQLKRMNDILQSNTDSLKEHMYRTELLEKLVEKMDLRLSPIESERIEKQVIEKYNKSKHDMLIKLAKLIGAIGTIIAIINGIKSL